PYGYLLFNSYKVEGPAMAALLASLTGMSTINRPSFEVSGLYVNPGKYLVTNGESFGENRRAVCFSITENNIKCSCVTREPEPEDDYPFDDGGYDPALLEEEVARMYKDEEYEEEDDEGYSGAQGAAGDYDFPGEDEDEPDDEFDDDPDDEPDDDF